MPILDRLREAFERNLDVSVFPFPNFPPAFMLMAYAAENLLKGIAVAKGRVRFSEQQLPKPLVAHDLNRLHKLASPKASVELDILETLTFMSLWQARYPCPTSVSDYWPVRDDGTPKAGGYVSPGTYNAVLAYYGALESELLNLIAAGS